MSSVWDLVNTHEAYPELIAVLAAHLSRPHPVRLREGIARALATPEANPAFNEILAAFRAGAENESLAFALHLAVAYSAGPAQRDVLMDLLRDESLGINRTEFAAVLWKSKDAEARALVKSMLNDPVIGDEVGRIIRGKRLK